MAKNFQKAHNGSNQKQKNHSFDNKMKGKKKGGGGNHHNDFNNKNKNNAWKNKKDWKKKPKEMMEIVESEFSSRPQQGSFPDKKKTLEAHRFEKKSTKKFERQQQRLAPTANGKEDEESMKKYLRDAAAAAKSKKWVPQKDDDEEEEVLKPSPPQKPEVKKNSSNGVPMANNRKIHQRENEENMKKHLNAAPSAKKWVSREIDENQTFAPDTEDEVLKPPPQRKPEVKKNPFELFDELLDSKKAKSKAAVDTVPMANNRKVKQRFNEEVAPEIDTSENDEFDEETMETDDDDEEEEEVVTKKGSSDDIDFHKKVSQMSMAQVKELRGKLGTKLFEKLLAESQQKNDEKNQEESEDEEEEDSENSGDEEGDDDQVAKDESSKKKSRHAPREMSSKKPVSAHRTIDPNAVNHSRKKYDPRFSERCGEYNESKFRKNYGFIDDMRKNDIKKLNSAMKQAKGKKEKERIKDLVGRLKSQQNSLEERDLWRATKNELLTSNIDRMNQGLKPVFVNNKQMKDRFKEKKLGKIEETQGKKGLEKYLKKKEKRDSKKKLL